MSAADEAIARVRKIDDLTREALIIKNLLRQMTAGHVQLGVMDRFGLSGERTFSAFPSTSADRFIQIAHVRVEEIKAEIEEIRAEFGKQDIVPEPTPVLGIFRRGCGA